MRTFDREIIFDGIGIHSGAPVHVRIVPSEKYGIFFRRVDIPNGGLIPATHDHVSDATKMNTTVGVCPNCVQTVEHLMAALFLAGVDTAIIEIDGPETPIMDGSALEFITKFRRATIVGTKPMTKIIVKRPVIAYRRDLVRQMPWYKRMMLGLHNLKLGRREDGYVKLSPGGKGLLIRATLDYPDKIIGRQSFDYLFDDTDAARTDFIETIARSRTFGRHSEWEYLKKRGLGRGATEKNVIALNDAGDDTLNKLYYPDEFVRHKIIDAIGDMYTSGGFIVGELESVKGSHGLNNAVLKKLFEDPSNYDIITA